MIKNLKPASPDVTVLHPEPPYKVLAVDGEAVEYSSYWVRRIQDGDVVEFDPNIPAAKITGSKK